MTELVGSASVALAMVPRPQDRPEVMAYLAENPRAYSLPVELDLWAQFTGRPDPLYGGDGHWRSVDFWREFAGRMGMDPYTFAVDVIGWHPNDAERMGLSPPPADGSFQAIADRLGISRRQIFKMREVESIAPRLVWLAVTEGRVTLHDAYRVRLEPAAAQVAAVRAVLDGKYKSLFKAIAALRQAGLLPQPEPEWVKETDYPMESWFIHPDRPGVWEYRFLTSGFDVSKMRIFIYANPYGQFIWRQPGDGDDPIYGGLAESLDMATAAAECHARALQRTGVAARELGRQDGDAPRLPKPGYKNVTYRGGGNGARSLPAGGVLADD